MSTLPSTPRNRDIVVIGCSAGGVEALPRILLQLPAGLPAAVCIVQHMASTHTPYLVDILRRDSAMPVAWAEQGAHLEHGRVYVAPPDHHLIVAEEHLLLSRGPRENYARPSIDKLFRSAAAAHGSRVIGVLLTGMLDDGVAGLVSIRDAGGVTIIQEPTDAAFPELPSRALATLRPDRTLPLAGIGAALRSLIVDRVASQPIPRDVTIEATLDREGASEPADLSSLGPQTTLSCPTCSGPLWQVGDERHRRLRCYLGHVYSAHELVVSSSEDTEAALWSALRALNDRAATLDILAQDARAVGNGQSAEGYAVRAREARREVDVLRRFMLALDRTQVSA